MLTVLVGVVALNPVVGSRLRQASYDLLQIWRTLLSVPRPPDGVVIVDLEPQYRRRFPMTNLVERVHLAQVLHHLKAGGAKAVVLDALLSDEDPSVDPGLAQLLAAHGHVVLGSHAVVESGRALRSIETANPLLLAAAATNGFMEFRRDSDGAIRELEPVLGRLQLRVTNRGIVTTVVTNLPTLSWVAAVRERPDLTRVEARRSRWWLTYYGGARRLPHTNGTDAAAAAAAGFFRNQIVVVGQRHGINDPGECPTGFDTFRSPYGAAARRYDGVEVHATALLNLLHGQWLREVAPWLQLLGTVLAGVGLGWGLSQCRPWRALALAAGLGTAAAAAAGVLAWIGRWWFPWLVLVGVQIPVALAWAVFRHSTRAYLENRLLVRSLSLYLSPQQVARIVRQPTLLQRGGRQQLVSILASDIAGFSRISERMDAEDLMALLNRYYEGAIDCVHATEGTVVKLIGDAIFALWNAPQEQEDHRARACRAALLLRERLGTFNAQPGTLPMRTRVGLHTGTACVGNVGSADRFEYTAVGEAVNLAFRLESLNKQLGTDILATRDALKGIHLQVVSRCLGHFRLKGFDHVVEVHELIQLAGRGASPAWAEPFAAGLHHFQRHEFDLAERAFRQTLSLRPEDGPARFYLETLTALRLVPLPPEWAGEIEIHEK